jgi:hypothetical protein
LKELYDNKRPSYFGLNTAKDSSFDVELVETIVFRMKRGKAAGLDGLAVEHIQFCHPCIYVLLYKLFNLIVKCGFVPDDFGFSYTIPIPKCDTSMRCKSVCVDDFRGITISSVLSKIFEYCVLDRYKRYFCTSDNQFGFKKGLGCSHAIFSIRSTIDQYVKCGSTVNLCAMDLKKAFDKVNHYGLFLKLMDRLIPHNLLSVFEQWFNNCYTCIIWGKTVSGFLNLPCGVRQGGVLSPYFFAIYVDDVIKKVNKSGLGCHFKNIPLCIIVYADDIILLAPSITALQQLIYICENELLVLDMILNQKKTVCMRIGIRFNVKCANLSTINGSDLCWVNSLRYLGVYLVSSRQFKCSYDNCRKSYFRAFNAVFGRIGRSAPEDVTIKLIESKCVPILLYGLDACPVNSADKSSFEFALNRSLMKIFQTNSISIIQECCSMFNIKCIASRIITRRKLFLERFVAFDDNVICVALRDVALSIMNDRPT